MGSSRIEQGHNRSMACEPSWEFPTAESRAEKPTERRHYMKNKAASIVIALALAAGVLTTSAQTLLYSNAFVSPSGLTPYGPMQMSISGQQLVLSSTVSSPMPTNNPLATCGPVFAPTLFPPGLLPDQQTLELRVDLVSANQNDAFAYLQWWVPSVTGQGKGYALFKDEDEIGLLKSWNDGAANACFFWTNAPLKNQNVTLVLAFTRVGSDLLITSRVQDKDNANAVLFQRTVTDTPQSDPVLLSVGVRSVRMDLDLVAVPWVLENRGDGVLGVWWANTQDPPQPAAQVIFDNLLVWQYATPQLTIQNAVVLSWPVTAAQFVVESAPGVSGPWETVPDPWLRTNATQIQMSVPAADNMRLFRLKFTP
jgi:hypothetical protein